MTTCPRCGLVCRPHLRPEQCVEALKQRVAALEERHSGMYRSATFYAMRYGELERSYRVVKAERNLAQAQLAVVREKPDVAEIEQLNKVAAAADDLISTTLDFAITPNSPRWRLIWALQELHDQRKEQS